MATPLEVGCSLVGEDSRQEGTQVRFLPSEAILKERVSMISNTLLILSGERLILVGLINHYQWKSGGLRQTDSSAYRESYPSW